VRNRGNVQKVAADLDIAYNTARNRLDDIVAALEAPDTTEHTAMTKREHGQRTEVLRRLSVGEIDFDEAMRLLAQ